MARIVLRPLASALPLGWFAFSTALVLVGAVELGWIDGDAPRVVPVILLTFVAPLEAAAAVGAFMERDTSSATGLALFAAFWVATGVIGLTEPIGAAVPALGILLVVFTVVLVALGGAALQGTPLVGALLFVAAVRTGLSAVHHLSGDEWMLTISGVIALVVAGAGFYGAVAFLLEDQGTPIMPLGRRKLARRSLSESIATQLEDVAREAGVRRRL